MAILKAWKWTLEHKTQKSPGLPAPLAKAFTPEYLLGQVEGIAETDVEAHIARLAYLRFLDDYYYGYLYDARKQCLRYVVHKGGIHLSGKVSALASAMVEPGRYSIENAGTWYMVENTGNALRNTIGYKAPEPVLGHKDLCELPVPFPLPSTLVLKWSLEDSKAPARTFLRYAELATAVVLAIALAVALRGHAAAMSAIKNIRPAVVIPAPAIVNRLAGFAAALKAEAASVTAAGGGLLKIEKVAGGIEVSAGFQDKAAKHAFAESVGSHISGEDAAVIYGVKAAR